jgi:hypothetical protein
MKKSIALFLFFILILNIFIISIKAELNPPLDPELGDINPETGLPNEIEKIKGIGENLTDSEIRSQYLKQEWGKIPEKNKFFGPLMRGYGKISPYTDPIFKYTLGITPSLTWLFVLTLILWIVFLIYIFRVMEFVSLFSPLTKYIVSLGLIVIISIIGTLRILAEAIINIISLFTTWWMQLIGISLVIIALIVASILSKNLKDVFKSIKEKRDEAKKELNQAKLERRIRVAEAAAEGLSGK